MTDNKADRFIVHYRTIDEDHQPVDDIEASTQSTQLDVNDWKIQSQEHQQHQQQPQQPPPYMPKEPLHTLNEDAQRDMIRSFVSGSQCLNGVSLTWAYFCYFLLLYN